MISYSRNFEDVILQRVFADVESGCYVDIGASHPVLDSNTYALYRKGWRGICVEPLGYVDLWNDERIEDIFVNAAAGAAAGETRFHVYRDTPQISTASSATAAAWREDGRKPDQTVRVPVLSLTDLLDEHLDGRPIHLLSIDVEGMEKDVLAGLDLHRYRPWIVVIEATRPGTPEPGHESWEPLLLAAGYTMVYRDGLNRFYLAAERAGLRERFELPPNVFDQFVLAREEQLRERCEALEASVRQLAEKLAALNAR
jgi:FkbM family methyltransferase